jgi:hypothetical protein
MPFLLTFTWEVCATRPTGSKATDDGLHFLASEGTWFRVELGWWMEWARRLSKKDTNSPIQTLNFLGFCQVVIK